MDDRKLLIKLPAHKSNASVRANSPTTNAAFKRLRRRLSLAPRPPSCSASVSDKDERVNAGKRLKRKPVIADRPSENAKTRPFKLTCLSSDRLEFGATTSSAFIHQKASATPRRPPKLDSKMLSVSSCRIRRDRCAPIAARIVNSFCRSIPRANSRFATLAQAIKSTTPTANERNRNKVR